MRARTTAILGLAALAAFSLLRTERGAEERRERTDRPWRTWRPGGVARGDGPGLKPDDWFTRQRAFPHPSIPEPARRHGLAEARAFRDLRLPGAASVAAWQPAGPTNVHGRITAIAADPADPTTVYIGAANGGVFRSADGGATWTPIFDDAPVLSVGALALSPGDGNVLYVGTGEANAAGDTYSGDGIWRTADGGNSWDHLGLDATARIGRIVIDPTDPDRIFVAAMGRLFSTNPERGLYRSLDGGASWSLVLFVNDSTGVVDVAIDPDRPDTLYAGAWERIRRPDHRRVGGPGSGIYRSVDGGDTWTLLDGANGLPLPSPTGGRIGLAVAASSPATVYAYLIDDPGTLMGIYRTTDAGGSWIRRDNGSDINDVTSSFGWYFGQIRVDPTDPDRVFVLGVPLYRSTNGGGTWSGVGSGMHVDHHALWIDPGNPDLVYAGNDGGFYVSTNGGGSWSKTGELPITQFYAITVDEQLPHRLYGGTQDNSTPRTRTGGLADWDVLYYGDGFYTLVDPRDSKVIYAEYQYGGLGKSTNGGNSWTTVLAGIPASDRRNWSTPVVMDPGDPDVLYYGTYRVFRSTDGAASWSPVSGDLTDGPYPGNLGLGTVTTLDVSATDSAAVIAGTDDGNVWITGDGGASWTRVSAGFPRRWVTRVAFDPTDHRIAYVTLSGYRNDEYLPHVFATPDGGSTWDDVSTNLPPIPLNDIVVDPDDPRILYVASDAGVYRSVNRGASWEVLGTGLPAAAVHDLHLHRGSRKLVAGTHGRSMFTYPLGDVTAATAPPPAGPGLTVAVLPNPTRRGTLIAFDLPAAGRVRASIFDLRGRRIRLLEDRELPPGLQEISWDGTDPAGRPVAAGTYFYRVEAGSSRAGGKVVVLR